MSARIELINGAYVHRLWSDSTPELLAAFQYSTDAEAFAKAKVEEDKGRDFEAAYLVTCTYSGAMAVFRREQSK
jgi:hypothetical protein